MPFPPGDDQFQDVTVKAVDAFDSGGWVITRSDGWSFAVPPESPVVPAAGMPVRFYGRGIGYTVRGLFLDGKEVFYRTEEGQREKDRQDQEERDRGQRYDYERDRAALAARAASLPGPLRARLDAFRRHNPDFGWKYESYELAVSELAARVAATLKTEEAVRAWAALDYEGQTAAVPLDGGLTGNMVGCATLLARLLLSDLSSVPSVPGALSPIVGASEFLPQPST